jgi:uncharacterized protein YecE (DUF72 family)
VTVSKASILVGIGGWDYDPWRGTFYPEGLPKTKQLEYASARLTAIEINATHYKLQTPELFRRWAGSVPDGFKFTIKASRFCTNRRLLAGAGEAIARFCAQGFTALGPKLGPILWQFMPTKAFDRGDFAAFLELLPREQDGVALRHALEVRHASFDHSDFFALASKAGAAVVFADSDEYPSIGKPTGGFSYARLMRAREQVPTGYPDDELDRWADVARGWAAAGEAYVFFINGAKVRAPAAAQALIERL